MNQGLRLKMGTGDWLRFKWPVVSLIAPMLGEAGLPNGSPSIIVRNAAHFSSTAQFYLALLNCNQRLINWRASSKTDASNWPEAFRVNSENFTGWRLWAFT